MTLTFCVRAGEFESRTRHRVAAGHNYLIDSIGLAPQKSDGMSLATPLAANRSKGVEPLEENFEQTKKSPRRQDAR
jgi:hypothetical protein